MSKALWEHRRISKSYQPRFPSNPHSYKGSAEHSCDTFAHRRKPIYTSLGRFVAALPSATVIVRAAKSRSHALTRDKHVDCAALPPRRPNNRQAQTPQHHVILS